MSYMLLTNLDFYFGKNFVHSLSKRNLSGSYYSSINTFLRLKFSEIVKKFGGAGKKFWSHS